MKLTVWPESFRLVALAQLVISHVPLTSQIL